MHFNRRGLVASGLAASGFAAAGLGGRAWAQAEPALSPLKDEPSRAQLFERVKAAALAEDPSLAPDAARYFNLYGPFRFPNDALFDVALGKARSNSIFGVDISHYTNTTFPIEQLAQRHVRFVYMKATQGVGSYDAKFAPFYARVVALPAGRQVHPGAYHFLSSSGGGADQAKAFLSVLRKTGALVDGKLRATDMPPVMDLEWDIAVANGPDRWKPHPPAAILREAVAFLEAVKSGTGRTPMIYTARAWWRERMGSADLGPLGAYPLWLADYSKTSRASETPPQIGSGRWSLWQFSDAATMALGFAGGFDANIFKGGEAEFLAAMDLKAFP